MRCCLLAWRQGLGGTKKAGSSVIFETFQGEIKVLTATKKKKSLIAKVGGP